MQMQDLLQSVVDEDGRLRIEMASSDRSAKFNFVYHQHLYLNNSNRFADLKAAALAGVNGTLLGLLIREMVLNHPLTALTFTLGAALLFAGMALALTVAFPRRVRRRDKGLLYWEGVRAYQEQEYVDELVRMSHEELLEKMLRHNHLLSGIVSRKYSLLNKAFVVSISGYLLLLFAFFYNLLV